MRGCTASRGSSASSSNSSSSNSRTLVNDEISVAVVTAKLSSHIMKSVRHFCVILPSCSPLSSSLSPSSSLLPSPPPLFPLTSHFFPLLPLRPSEKQFHHHSEVTSAPFLHFLPFSFRPSCSFYPHITFAFLSFPFHLLILHSLHSIFSSCFLCASFFFFPFCFPFFPPTWFLSSFPLFTIFPYFPFFFIVSPLSSWENHRHHHHPSFFALYLFSIPIFAQF